MRPQQALDRLVADIAVALGRDGFTFVESFGGFTCPSLLGARRVRLKFIQRGAYLRLATEFSIHADDIQQVYHAVRNTPRRERQHTATLWASPQVISTATEDEPVVRDATDIADAATFVTMCSQVAENEFFHRYESLEAIEHVLNLNPPEHLPICPSRPHRAAYGVIAASLVGESVEERAKQHRDALASLSKGFYLDDFDALVAAVSGGTSSS